MSREEQVRAFLSWERQVAMVERGLFEERRARQVARELERAAFAAAVSMRPDVAAEADALGAPRVKTTRVAMQLYGRPVAVVDGLTFDWAGVRLWRPETRRDRGRRAPGEEWPVAPEDVPFYPGNGVTGAWRAALVGGKEPLVLVRDLLDGALQHTYLIRPPNEDIVMTRRLAERVRKEHRSDDKFGLAPPL